MNVSCSAKVNACPLLLSSACVFYEGENLLYIGVNMNDSLQTALEKLNVAFSTLQGEITLTTIGSSGPSTFISDVLNVPNYTLSGLGGSLQAVTDIGSVTTNVITANGFTLPPQGIGLSTFKISQIMGENDYWNIYGYATVVDYGELVFELNDNAASINGQKFRFYYNNSFSGTSKDILLMTYDGATIDGTLQVNNLAGIGTRMVVADTAGLLSTQAFTTGTVTSVATSGPITGGPITSSGTIGITQSTISTDGYLSSIDWNTFNNKQNAIALTTTGSSGPSTFNGTSGALNIPDYSAAFSGFVPTSRQLAINGTTYDLSADRSWTVSSDNIYTANGTLAGDRVVNNSTFLLQFKGGQVSLGNEETALRLETSTTGKQLLLSLNNLSGKNWLIRSLGDGTLDFRNITNTRTSFSLDGASSDVTFNANIKNSLNYFFLGAGAGGFHKSLTLGKATPTVANYSIAENGAETMLNADTGGLLRFRIANADKMMLTNAGRLLLGTTTESTFILDVNGTARVRNFLVENTSTTTTAEVNVSNNPSSGANGYFRQYGTIASGTAWGLSLANATLLFSNDSAYLLIGTLSAQNLVFGTNNAERGRFTSAGRLLLGTTSEGTHLLDVNGSARITLPAVGTSSYLVISSATASAFNSYIGTTASNQYAWFTNIKFDGSAFVRDSATRSAWRMNQVVETTDALSSVNFDYFNPSGVYSSYFSIYGGGNIVIGNTTNIESAILSASSTTKGFLPPRMTTGQINAIATPASGLIVYDNTTNVPNYYNGTAWVGLGTGTGTVTSIATTGPITGGTITTSGTIGITQATASTNGYLSSTDWNTFNNKLNNNIYTADGVLTANRTVGTATGFKLTLNPNLEVITTTYNVIPTMLGWSAVNGYVQTTIPASTSFSATGYAFSALIGNNYMTYQGSATFAANTLTGAIVGINNIGFTAASSTITITQSSSIRTYSAGLFQNTISGSVNGTITHMSGLAVRPIFQASGTSVITVTNNYGLLIADQNEFSHATITNRWGIYQEGISDKNYFSSKLLVGTTTDIASAKVIIDSTSQGVLVPRMTTTQINAITSPADGLLVYNTTISHMCCYLGGTWHKFNSSNM